MKNFIVYILLVLSCFTAASQNETLQLSPQQQEELKTAMESYFESLNLSDEQKLKFTSISKRYAYELFTIRDSDANKYKKMKQLKANRNNKNKEMKAFLNQEQYQIYLQKQEDIQKAIKAKRKNN